MINDYYYFPSGIITDAHHTSKDIRGLVAQGRTATEALEIARDMARKLIEAQAERSGKVNLSSIDDSFDYPLIVNA